jgi:hypothetical protein
LPAFTVSRLTPAYCADRLKVRVKTAKIAVNITVLSVLKGLLSIYLLLDFVNLIKKGFEVE